MKGPSMRRRRPDAFTLIEVLISVVAFSIVLAAINAVFYSALRLHNRTTSVLDEALPRQQALSIIKRDLSNLVVPGGPLSGVLQTAQIPTGLGGQGSPEFYTASGQIDETSPWAEIEKVSYVLAASTNRGGGMDLLRAVTRNLLPVTGTEQPAQQWLMTGVRAMSFLYYDGTQWRDSWDSTTPDPTTGLSNALPQAIKVQIQTIAADGGRGLSENAPEVLVVPIFVQARKNQTQQSTGGSAQNSGGGR
jgi:type II secretion system protein J